MHSHHSRTSSHHRNRRRHHHKRFVHLLKLLLSIMKTITITIKIRTRRKTKKIVTVLVQRITTYKIHFVFILKIKVIKISVIGQKGKSVKLVRVTIKRMLSLLNTTSLPDYTRMNKWTRRPCDSYYKLYKTTFNYKRTTVITMKVMKENIEFSND